MKESKTKDPCIFNSKVECPVQKRFEAPVDIMLRTACPICPKRALMEEQPPASIYKSEG